MKMTKNNLTKKTPSDFDDVIYTVLEWTKQITTLATGTLVLSATFIKDIFQNKIEYHFIIILAWVFFAISILFGIILMGNICYLTLQKKVNIYANPTRIIAIMHFMCFFIGLVLFIFFVSQNFNLNGGHSKAKLSGFPDMNYVSKHSEGRHIKGDKKYSIKKAK